jgi:predicted TIM-barrel fold metal-dependent hydrolase
MRRRVLPVLSVLIGLAAVVATQQLPPGQLRPRPGQGRAPEFPAPTITDYKPRSTLVVPEHKVPRAKFPVIDIHFHPPGQLASPEVMNRVAEAITPLNLRLMISASGASGDRLQQTVAAIAASPHKDRFVTFTNVNWGNVAAGGAQQAVAQLEADVKAGARGVGEVGKGLGMSTRKPDGSRLKLDDPVLDPIWEACARLKIPVLIHTGDPSEFFQPLDFNNERWLEMALFANRRFFDRARYPAFDDLMAERDRMLMKHPKTTFVLAHLGWHANDLARLGRLMDKLPNLHGEVGAILYDLGRQPRFAHDFFVKYQDRILFGKDSFQPDEYPYYWRVFETSDEYFDYYRDYHAFWKLYGMNLPDAVLKKLYYQNALRIVPGLPKGAFPK